MRPATAGAVRCLDGVRGLAFVILVVGCARPVPVAPANVAPPPEQTNPVGEDVVIDHDAERIQQRARALRDEAARRARHDELRAKIRDGRITCTPTGNRIHGPSAVCTETMPAP